MEGCRLPASCQSLFDGAVVCFTKVRLSCFFVALGKSSSVRIRAVWQVQKALAVFCPLICTEYLRSTRATFHLLGSACSCIIHRWLCSRTSALDLILLVTCTLPCMQPPEMCLKELRQSWSVQVRSAARMASATKGSWDRKISWRPIL